ncbi:MAG: hypothetical protein E5Y79_16115 [Mesorhizobium sp.]|nr:MAG: hypothetical protein E5Y79_16115 [Mesorhizobium sp.]
MPNWTTNLRLDPIGVPPYSARGITQWLEPDDGAAQLARTVNGTLVDLSDYAFQKFISEISCSDQQPPALSGVWPGRVLTVDCVCELCFRTDSDLTPSRPIAATTDDPAIRTENGFTFYRPRLTMMVVDWTVSFAEWEADYSWSLRLAEV